MGKAKRFLPCNQCEFQRCERPDFRPAPAVMRFIRRHPGAQKGGAANLGSLFEPRREQNLYANPKRTAKSFAHYTDIDAPEMQMVQKNSEDVLFGQMRDF
ncbi:MAG: hypothetical protein ABSD77_03775 [Verrucomicrobiota bacterium]